MPPECREPEERSFERKVDEIIIKTEVAVNRTVDPDLSVGLRETCLFFTTVTQEYGSPKAFRKSSHRLNWNGRIMCCNWRALQPRQKVLHILATRPHSSRPFPPTILLDSDDPLLLSLQETPHPQPICSKVHIKSIWSLESLQESTEATVGPF